MKNDIVAARNYAPGRQHGFTPHEFLFTPRDVSLAFDFAHYVPTRYVLARHLQVQEVTAHSDDCDISRRHGERQSVGTQV